MVTESILSRIPQLLSTMEFINESSQADINYNPDDHNNYDDFSETHSALATAFHNRMKANKIINIYHVPYNSMITTKFYKSKSECKKAIENCIRAAYDDVQNLFDSGNPKSIAQKSAAYYSKRILSAFDGYQPLIEKLCTEIERDVPLHLLRDKLNDCHKNLLNSFNEELNDSRDFYSLYDIDYFIDQVNIEEHDYRYADGIFLKALETMLTDHIEYTITDIYSAISEIQDDADSRANTFYGLALSE
ncbi:hypothetical protein [Agathobacter sp.]